MGGHHVPPHHMGGGPPQGSHYSGHGMSPAPHFSALGSVHVGGTPIPQPQHLHGHHMNHQGGPSYIHQAPAHHVGHPQHSGAPQPLDRSQMRSVAAAPLLSSAVLCVATGPLEHAKSQLCRVIEERKDFKHLALEDQFDDNGTLVESRLEMLERELSEAQQGNPGTKPRGFVIENAVARTKHEIFLVDNILRRYRVRLQSVVLLNASGVSDEPDYVKHPVGFEVCARYVGEDRLVVLDPECSAATFSGVEAFEKLVGDPNNAKMFDFTSDPLPVELDVPAEVVPLVGAPTGALTLVHDAKLNFQILRSVAAALSFNDLFTSCWTLAARVLEYSFFTRRSHYLRSFFATTLLDGDRVAVVGYGKHVYIVLGPAGLAFRIDDNSVPPSLAQLTTEATDDAPLTFILAATVVDGKPVVSLADVLLLRKKTGKALFAEERFALLHSLLPTEYGQGGITFKTAQYTKLQESVVSLSRPDVCGLSLVNPGFAAPGVFERQNFTWWTDDYHKFDVRLWNGHTRSVHNEEYWFFEALVLSGDGEDRMTYGPELESVLYVVIPDAKVSEEWINDGNVVEVTYIMLPPPPAAAATGKLKSAVAAKASATNANGLPAHHLRFEKRRPFTTHPTSRVFADVLCGNTPKWPKESFLRSAPHLPYLQMRRRADEAGTPEKPEFA